MLTNSLKSRFCKDMNIPIRVYDEPYFSERIELLDPYYGTKDKLIIFKQALENYENESDYYKAYNKIKDEAIDYLKENLKGFLELDMNKYRVVNQKFTSNDVYKENNIGKTFISIDIVKANFTSIKHFDTDIFPEIDTYEEFIRQFTDEEHFINSKYIRQVIFGNNNPKRQVGYQKYLMDGILTHLLTKVNPESIASFSNDEIVIKISDGINMDMVIDLVNQCSNGLELKTEEFILDKAYGGYKKVYKDGLVSFKDLNSVDIIYAIREHQEEEVEENDKVFIYENKLAKFL